MYIAENFEAVDSINRSCTTPQKLIRNSKNRYVSEVI